MPDKWSHTPRYKSARHQATHAQIQKCQAPSHTRTDTKVPGTKPHIPKLHQPKREQLSLLSFHISYTDNYIISELYYSSVSSAASSASSGTGSNAFTLRLIFLSAALHSTTTASTVSPTL